MACRESRWPDIENCFRITFQKSKEPLRGPRRTKKRERVTHTRCGTRVYHRDCGVYVTPLLASFTQVANHRPQTNCVTLVFVLQPARINRSFQRRVVVEQLATLLLKAHNRRDGRVRNRADIRHSIQHDFHGSYPRLKIFLKHLLFKTKL